MRSIKQRIKDFISWNVRAPIQEQLDELLYQHLFAQQCGLAGIRNDYYGVGAAANYSLLYLLARTLTTQRVSSILEFGSGETTRLIDTLRHPGSTHVCYEHDAFWHGRLSRRLTQCDYRLRRLTELTVDGRRCLTYEGAGDSDFELFLVDGPQGTEEYSRLGCLEVVRRNRQDDFLIVLDDCDRAGEQQTVRLIDRALRDRGANFQYAELKARKTQGVFVAGRFADVLYYW